MNPLFTCIVFTFCFVLTSVAKVVGIDSPYSIQISGYEEFIPLTSKTLFHWENKQSKKVHLNEWYFNHLPFKSLPNPSPNFGFIQHDVWFHFSVQNSQNYDQVIFLSINNPNLDVAEIHKVIETGSLIPLDQGDLVPEHLKRVLSRKIAFRLEIPSLTYNDFYLRVNNGGEQFHFGASLQSARYFYQNEAGENYFLGIYIGILCFVILFNFFMWLITKEKLSLNYSLYLITFLFLQLSLLGFGKLYLWPNANYLINHANPFFATASVFFLLRFSRIYLNLAVLLPKIDRIFKFFQFPLIIIALLSLLPYESAYTLSIIAVNGFTLLLNLFILPVAIIAIRKGYQPAKLFLIAFLLLVISVFAFVLKNFGILPSNFFTDYGFQFGSTAEVILFSLGIVIRFKNFREEAINRLEEINDIKEKANVVLEEKVKLRTEEIEHQKREIEEKNDEIISSISYAKRIQEAILPNSIKQAHLLPTSALWYAPKDIVAGDFYWVEEKHLSGIDYVFFAVGDCTGHGVPGAMMSVLCTNALNAALAELNSPSTTKLLERCNSLLLDNLSQHSETINDGMDISLCCFDAGSKTLIWSGANNPLWILRNEEIIEFSPTKRPIGNSSISAPFEEHKMDLNEGDFLFIFSDGIIDQFGGEKGKKFKKSGLREAALYVQQPTSETLVKSIKQTVENWMSQTEQIDDIALLIVGIEF